MTKPTSPATDSAPRRLGRRAGDPEDTRQEILHAARRRFAMTGFAGTSMRAIAGDADVDPALLLHHFGSKRDLFLAAHRVPSNPRAFLGAALDARPEQRGRLLARAFVGRFLKDPEKVGLSLLRSAATEPAAADLLRQTLEAALASHATHLAIDAASDAEALSRVAIASAILTGVVFHAGILALEPLAGLGAEELAERVGPAVQASLAGTIG